MSAVIAAVWIGVSMVILFVGTYRNDDDMAVLFIGIAWPVMLTLAVLFAPVWVPIALGERMRKRQIARRKALRDVDKWLES